MGETISQQPLLDPKNAAAVKKLIEKFGGTVPQKPVESPVPAPPPTPTEK